MLHITTHNVLHNATATHNIIHNATRNIIHNATRNIIHNAITHRVASDAAHSVTVLLTVWVKHLGYEPDLRRFIWIFFGEFYS